MQSESNLELKQTFYGIRNNKGILVILQLEILATCGRLPHFEGVLFSPMISWTLSNTLFLLVSPFISANSLTSFLSNSPSHHSLFLSKHTYTHKHHNEDWITTTVAYTPMTPPPSRPSHRDLNQMRLILLSLSHYTVALSLFMEFSCEFSLFSFR